MSARDRIYELMELRMPDGQAVGNLGPLIDSLAQVIDEKFERVWDQPVPKNQPVPDLAFEDGLRRCTFMTGGLFQCEVPEGHPGMHVTSLTTTVDLDWSKVEAKTVKVTQDQLDHLSGEAEQLRVQLAGCGVAANGGPCGGNEVVASRGDYGWTPAYQAVLDLRQKYEDLERMVRKLAEELGVDLQEFYNAPGEVFYNIEVALKSQMDAAEQIYSKLASLGTALGGPKGHDLATSAGHAIDHIEELLKKEHL